MKFTEIRNSMRSFSGASTPDYQLSYITADVKNLIEELNYKFVDYLTRDITDDEYEMSLQKWLGSPYYPASNEYAKECIEFCPYVKHIWGRKIKSWTDSALKCYDNFLLKYIQIDKGETIPKTHSTLKETDVYNYLIKKGGKEQEIGQNFINIYQLRSSFQHIQKEELNGTRVPRTISNSKFNTHRDTIIQNFRQSLITLFSLINNNLK